MPDRVTPGDDASDPSPLDILPGLTAVAETMSDGVAVTDLHRRVVVWNTAVGRLYGIPPSEALGRPIETLYDSTIIGEGTSSAGARTIALEAGSWRGRVTDRPLMGRLVGQELVIETVLSRIDDPNGQPVGVFSLKRDVTAGVRVERELSTVISLATAAGGSRTRQGAADRALDMLVATTGASVAGLTIPAADGTTTILAERGMPDRVRDVASAVIWAESPAVKSVATLDRTIQGMGRDQPRG